MRELRPRSLLLLGGAALAALAVLLSLGVWQLERRAWKEELIARVEARAFAKPGEIPSEAQWATWSAADDEYRRVQVTGVFLHGKETLVHGLMEARRGQPVMGFYVLTPMQLRDGAIVIINRGFVPQDLRLASSRPQGQIAGETTVVGLMRAPERRGAFVPENDPRGDNWFVRDPAEIAKARGLARVAPFYIDADATAVPGGWPRGGQTRLTFPNNHLQYAFTWFGLALTLVGVASIWFWQRLNGRRA